MTKEQNTKHEGLRPYADAAHAQNMLVFPYFCRPEQHMRMNWTTPLGKSAAAESLSDPELKSVGRYFSEEALMLRKGEDFIRYCARFKTRAAIGAACFSGIFAGISAYNYNQSEAPLSEKTMENLTKEATDYCSDKLVTQESAEVSSIVRSQAAKFQTSGLKVAYEKSAADMTKAVQECVPQSLETLKAGDRLPAEVFGAVSLALALALSYATFRNAVALRKDNKMQRQMGLQADILDGDLAVVRAEAERRKSEVKVIEHTSVSDSPVRGGFKFYC